MRKLFIFIFLTFFLSFSSNIMAQNKPNKEKIKLEKPYKPAENAQEKINGLIAKAKKENKHIILQAGGNWCVWCLRFNDFISKNKKVNQFLKANYLYYHLNYSTENKNKEVFEKYAPEGSKLGYPFFIILDENGKVLGLQESGSLENGTSYDETKVLSFLKKYSK